MKDAEAGSVRERLVIAKAERHNFLTCSGESRRVNEVTRSVLLHAGDGP